MTDAGTAGLPRDVVVVVVSSPGLGRLGNLPLLLCIILPGRHIKSSRFMLNVGLSLPFAKQNVNRQSQTGDRTDIVRF